MSRSSLAVAVTGAVVLAVAVGAAVIVGRAATQEPAAPATDPAGVSSTRLPSPDPSYWTPERMRSARPASMPQD